MQLIPKSFKQVFKKPGYVILTIVVAGLVLLLSIWLRNSRLLVYVFNSELFGWEARVKIIWTSLGMFKTGFTTGSRIIIICLALLSGINISLLIFYLKNKAEVLKTAGISGLSLIIGLLGIGCGACGSVILSSIFGLTVAAGLIGVLPFDGLEFGLLGIVLILVSIYLLAKKINQQLYRCPECGLEYKDKKWAAKCEAWCKKYKSCNLEIIKHSINNKGQ